MLVDNGKEGLKKRKCGKIGKARAGILFLSIVILHRKHLEQLGQ